MQRAGIVWALLSVLALAVGLLLSMPVLGFVEGTLGVEHRVGLGLWPIVWGALAIGGCLGAAELALSVRPPVTLAASIAAIVGMALATVTQVTLFNWSVARYGAIDSDFVGLTAGMFAVLVAIATAGFATLIAPASVVGWPAVVTMICGAVAVAIGASNTPGIWDGMGPESVPLAAALVVDGIYAVTMVVVATMRLRGRSARRALRVPSDPV